MERVTAIQTVGEGKVWRRDLDNATSV